MSSIVESRFEQATPREGLRKNPFGEELDGKAGAHCQRFDGDWDRLPDFKSLVKQPLETVARIELAAASGSEQASETDPRPVNCIGEHVALLFSGNIFIRDADVYVYELSSDDGSRLWIDDELVIDNDGLHSAQARPGRIALGPGWHAILVGWFNKTGGAELSLSGGSLGTKLRPVDVRFRTGSGIKN